MAQIPSKEGRVPFKIPGKDDVPGSTYYKVFGDLSNGKPVVVVLHGGPGGGHDYLISFADLWSQYGLAVVFYDQIGCGSSTHLREAAGDKSFWQESLFVAELNNLLDHLNLRDGSGFHILGQSWGGMLGAAFAATRPRGLQRLVIASGLASTDLAGKGMAQRLRELPLETSKVLEECIQKRSFEGPAYEEAMAVFRKSFVCRTEPIPPELQKSFQNMREDTTVYSTMYGPSVLLRNGSLRSWTCVPRLPQITAPTLVYNAEYDTSHDIAQVPFFELIPRVRWITIANAAHMCHVEDGGVKERVLRVVGDFLTQNEDSPIGRA